jgi:hypothetical protein
VNATAPGVVATATVRAHIELLHAQAARAFDGAERPGVLQLVSIDPTGGAAVVTRFAIGEVDRMVEAAIADANAGKNVYVEARTVSDTLRGRARERKMPRAAYSHSSSMRTSTRASPQRSRSSPP